MIVLVFALSSPCTSPAEEILWPIDYNKAVSSSFGEPRPGRVHYGVDFKSGGVIGKKVYAIGDGYIYRAQTTPFGYGKSLYIKLDSGEIIVYGHLSKYLPKIEDIFFDLRIQEKTYDVEWWPGANEYRVKKGEVIAYSGNSGGSTPHLHLEIRDKDNNPLNPLEQGINVRDTIPPNVKSIILIPLDKNSSVDGFPVARWYDFSNPNNEPVYLSGKIGVAAETWDTVNDSNNILGVYRLSLAVESDIVFSKQYDELSYLYNGQGGLDYLPGDYYGGSGSVSALFRRDGNFLNIYQGKGILTDSDPGSVNIKTVTVKAVDYTENLTSRSFSAAFGEKPKFEYCGFTGEGNFRIAGVHNSGLIDRAEIFEYSDDEWKLADSYYIMKNKCDINIELPQTLSNLKIILTAQDSTESVPVILKYDPDSTAEENTGKLNVLTELLHDRIIVRINSNRILSSVPVVCEDKSGIIGERIICSIPDGETSWIASIPLPETGRFDNNILVSAFDISGNKIQAETQINVTVLDTSENTATLSADSLMTVEVSPGALYRPSSMRIIDETVTGLNGLKQVSGGYRVLLGDKPLKDYIHATIKLDSEPPEKAALFYANGSENSNTTNKWRFIPTKSEGNILTGNINGSVCVAVLSDTTPPYVQSQSPRSGGTIKNRKPKLVAYVEDKGAGIEGSDSFTMSIDSIPVYAEYDYARHTISYTLHNNLSIGKHVVKLSVSDRLENTKTIEWSFNIAP
ncbi:M23 family metallopeptidase [Candidatus Latescibacterota bacterium]